MDTIKTVENILTPLEHLAEKNGIEFIEFLNGGENYKSIFIYIVY